MLTYSIHLLHNVHTHIHTHVHTCIRTLSIPTMTYNRRTYAEVLSAPPPLRLDIDSYDKTQDGELGLWQPVPRLQVAIPELDMKASTLLAQRSQLRPEAYHTLEPVATLESLTQLESRCITLVKRESTIACLKAIDRPAETIPWADYIDSHRALLYEHYNLILASLSPDASLDVHAMPIKHHLPRRMWSNGMQPLLGVLQDWSSIRDMDQAQKFRAHMRDFIVMAYALVALLYETAPVFKDSWTLYLSHLSRYRASVEKDVGEQEYWQALAESWHSQLFTLGIPFGELYYSVSDTPGLDPAVQLLRLAQSVMSARPPPASQHGLLCALSRTSHISNLPSINSNFIGLHGLLAEARYYEKQHQKVAGSATSLDWMSINVDFLVKFSLQMRRFSSSFREAVETSFQDNKNAWDQLTCNAIINIAGWFEYGADDAALTYAFASQHSQAPIDLEGVLAPLTPSSRESCKSLLLPERKSEAMLSALRLNPVFQRNLGLTMDMLSTLLGRTEAHLDPHIHIIATFLNAVAAIKHTSHLMDSVPWAIFVRYLNSKIEHTEQDIARDEIHSCIVEPMFRAEQGLTPLPEDLMMRGLLWTAQYFPKDWFDHDQEKRGESERDITKRRNTRLLKLGYKLSQVCLHDHTEAPALTYQISTRSGYLTKLLKLGSSRSTRVSTLGHKL